MTKGAKVVTGPVADTAQAILVAHQRRDIRSCLCGWSELGRCHAGHQVQMLAEAGLLAAAMPPVGDL